ncbi:MAG: DUF2817 domain-containing protein [Candidatus Odyssella sp.]|nr:DUF2817 domain-containing protein [Candidatus Odyssella sp.]
MSLLEMFSARYPMARTTFLGALKSAGGTHLAAHENPRKGPAGEALYADIARIGPDDAKRLLILVSGTHGIEGYSGSGCHAAWLASGLFARQAGADTAVLFVHAINPFGFAWGRRTNEDNVDLNRNFVDHAKPRPANADYEAIAEHVDPVDWGDAAARAKHNAAIAKFLGRETHDVMSKAMHGGQYVNPKGTFYGGTAPTWSNRIFRAAVAEHAARAEQVAIIDYHTGGGLFGFVDFFVDDDRDGVTGRDGLSGAAKSRHWFSHATVIAEDKARYGKDAQSETPGNLFYAVPEIVPGKRYTLGLVELRTGEAKTGIDAIRAENWLFHHGDIDSPEGAARADAIRAEVRERFYPASEVWRAMVLRQSHALIGEALAGLAKA